MVENYTKDLKESVYHGAVVSVLAVGYTMLRKTLVKMGPPSLGKFGSNYLFSSLSKESIDKERKRHDKAIEDLQRAQIEWAKKRQE